MAGVQGNGAVAPRAEAVAVAGDHSSAVTDADTYLVFEIEEHRYALPVAGVLEVLPALAVDPLPGSPPALLGAITLRGRIVPVADTRRLLGQPPQPIRLQDHFLVAETDGRPLVVPCDRVIGLARLARAEDADALTLLRGGGRVAWVARDEQGLVLVPDLRGCLAEASSE